MTKVGIFKSEDFVFLSSFCVDSSSLQISAILRSACWSLLWKSVNSAKLRDSLQNFGKGCADKYKTPGSQNVPRARAHVH